VAEFDAPLGLVLAEEHVNRCEREVEACPEKSPASTAIPTRTRCGQPLSDTRDARIHRERDTHRERLMTERTYCRI
jgi:hypothetical protein